MTVTAWNITGSTIPTTTFVNLVLENGVWYPVRGGGGGSRTFKCLLNGALHKADSSATIDTVTAIDGGSAPSPTTAANYLRWAGNDDDPCFIVEDWSSGTVAYILTNVAWDIVTPVENVFTASVDLLKQTKQNIIGKTDAATADTTIDTGTSC
jgi:hypothetical protein